MSEYPDQARSSRGGWPEQPPHYSRGQRDAGYQRGSWEGRHPSEPRPRRRRRRRGRGWTVLLVTVIVLAGVFAVVDQVARVYAQNTVAKKLVAAGLPVKPSVSIKGWPFLTQVLLAHDVGRTDVSARNVREGSLDIASIDATALDTHINSGFNSATVDTIDGTALVTFSSLVAATGANGVSISADPSDGPNAAKISAGPLSGVASVSQSGPSSVSVRAQSLGGIPLSALGSLGDYTIKVPHLPMGAAVTGVSVRSQGVAIRISAHHTTLSGASALPELPGLVTAPVPGGRG